MHLQELDYWIREREDIRCLKGLGKPKPWSQDPVFQTTYFCNVRREHDKVTHWLRANWMVDDANYEFAMVMARLINKPATLSEIGYPYDIVDSTIVELDTILDRVRNVALLCSERGITFWGNAYVVTTHGQPMSKLDYLIGVLRRAHNVLPFTGVAGTCADYHRAFKTLEGFSDFMAAQIVADLKNTPFHVLNQAPDWFSFVAPGPGSKRGMEWAIGKGWKFNEGIAHIRTHLREMGNPIIDRICNQDLQNCLCEFDKYMRVRTGSGRSKRKYNGR